METLFLNCNKFCTFTISMMAAGSENSRSAATDRIALDAISAIINDQFMVHLARHSLTYDL